MRSLGRHLMVELYNCDSKILNDVHKVETIIVADDVSPTESGTSEIEKYTLAKLNATNTARLFRQAYSDEMIFFLDSALNLGAHYKIERNREYDAKLFSKIYRHLKIIKLDFSITTIKFSDRDRFLAANAVNLVYDKLKSINREYLYSALKRKTYVYTGLIKRLNNENSREVNELRDIFNGDNAQKFMATNSDLKISILKSLAQIEQNNNSLKDAEQIVAWSTEAIADTSMQNIWLINKGKVADAIENEENLGIEFQKLFVEQGISAMIQLNDL